MDVSSHQHFYISFEADNENGFFRSVYKWGNYFHVLRNAGLIFANEGQMPLAFEDAS